MLRSIGKQSGESVESVLEFRGVSTAAAARHHYFAPNTGAEYCDKRVCLSVCLSVFVSPSLQNCTSDLHQFLCMLTMAVARSSSGGVVIRYVLPVLWMTSYCS